MTEKKIVGKTESVCPVCLKRIEAVKIAEEDGIYLEKTCAEHGFFRVLIWRGSEADYLQWARPKQGAVAHLSQHEVEKGCPYDCGLCAAHEQQTCCVLLEVTSRCNLGCPVCFASAGTEGVDASLTDIASWYDALMAAGGPFNIQLSGGEPTLRDDLPEIITMGREKGFTFFQLNTNGLRLAYDTTYIKALADAGLNCVFLQFDGLSETPYEVLRGKPLLAEKLRAIANCAAAGLGIVLVPTLAPEVNMTEIGAIIQFALEHMPQIRGVHFQPISYFGRCGLTPDESRLTLPDVLQAIEDQTDGRMKVADFAGGGAENAYCSFHGNFMLQSGTQVKAIKSADQGCCQVTSKQSRDFVAKRWTGVSKSSCCCTPTAEVAESSNCNTRYLDEFLAKIETQTLAVSGMLFQDAWNLDLDRLKRCYISEVSPSGHLIPFCAYNLTNAAGQSLYRGRS